MKELKELRKVYKFLSKGKMSGYIAFAMEIIHRLFELNLPPGRSAFLWGQRKAEKNYRITHYLSQITLIDLLKTDVFCRIFYDLKNLKGSVIHKIAKSVATIQGDVGKSK